MQMNARLSANSKKRQICTLAGILFLGTAPFLHTREYRVYLSKLAILRTGKVVKVVQHESVFMKYPQDLMEFPLFFICRLDDDLGVDQIDPKCRHGSRGPFKYKIFSSLNIEF